MSNIVYSSSICLSEAIDTANRLKADMKSIRTHDLSDASSSVCDEDLILHKAVAILRKHIGDLSHAFPQLFWWNCVVFVDSVIGNII
jgi:hypothetical protein